MRKDKFRFGIFFIFVILSLCFVSATYTRSNVQWSQYNPTVSEELNENVCGQGQDFLLQISPFGCTPAVVRTDLLEENDVPVYCQIGATKINPLIDVEAIDSISFSGQYPKEIAGIGFHPAKAALGVEGQLNSPVLNNIGYVVILLKKQANASAIPDYISGNLTARVRYNVENAFGVGNALFYLPEMSDEDFEDKQVQYSFWSGKGTLRADSIETDSAQISVYQNGDRISGVNLEKGETSNSIYLPGFQCMAGLKLKLNDLENPDTGARLRINAEVVEVAKNEKFLDNKCRVTDMSKSGIVQEVKIKCQEDDKKTTTGTLVISPRIVLNIDGEDKTVEVGDYLYDESGERKVYLAYIGTDGSTTSSNDLYIYLMSSPLIKKDRLSNDEISSWSVLFEDMLDAGHNSAGVIESVSDFFKVSSGVANRHFREIVRGEKIARINADSGMQVFTKTVSIAGFADTEDKELTGEAKNNYENAKSDYKTIRESYSSEPFTKDRGSSFGEEALYREILLAWDAAQKATVTELCKEFEQDYPNSKKIIEECSNPVKLSSQDAESIYVTINKKVKKISFDGVYEPSFSDYGVRVLVRSSDGKMQFFDLTKDRIVYFNASGNDYLQLISADEDSARIRTSLDGYGMMESIIKEFGSDIITLDMNVARDLGKGYSFTLTQVNLKKIAKVSVIPNIDNAGTSANFSFTIGIEKRAIELSPDRIKNIIENLDSEIKDWTKVSNSLGKMVEGLKASCLVTGVALITKNFLLNTGGAGIARRSVMRGENGWNEKCVDLVNKGTYSSQEQCYNENADAIDKEVDELLKVMDEQNSDIKSLEEGITTSEFLGEKAVDTDKFMERYIPEVEDCIRNNLPETIADPSGKSESINKNDILTVLSQEGYKNRIFSVDKLREIDLYCRANSNKNLGNISKQRLYSNLFDVKTNSKNFAQIVTWAGEFSAVSADDMTFMEIGEKVKRYSYTGLTNEKIGNKISGEGISSNTPLALVPTSDGRKFIVPLDASSGTSQFSILRDNSGLMIYDSYGARVSKENIPDEFSKVYFERIDASSYKNQYKNAELQYYETEPYKGMPAIVPFDLSNGWYAATKQTLGIGNNIQSYESSGRVSSFYLCNVGANGLEENIGGDDICEMINTGTGQSYNQFPGLSESESSSLIRKSVQAIEQASKLYKSGLSGKVSILGEKIDVGEPAVDIPDYQCQDFMSPKECLLLFNLCDPVICPSSRCDLGGTYPVSNVVQSGVIGSIALCLPNVKDGIIIPVCLTGIKAGIDGFLSIKQSYRDCLQESLDTGEMVGICDEIYSIYICDFFWRQALPVADIVIPKIFEIFLGQNVRGGGEYLGVADAWDNAGKSVDYFVDYYGANAKEAFIARTTEVAKAEVCKSFVSGVVPTGGDLLDQLTEPDSPPQFHGRFDKISLTTVTVPPTSHYKVFYHIYAGQDSGVYYQVYLKGSLQSSYYKDTAQDYMVASGYVSVGDYASETKDFVATSGYNELCINVNGQEECGFGEVSTSFAVNYIEDKYLASQASETDITSESDCISGTSSIYSVLNPNVQSAAEELINPEIYNEGITRICATDNPGLGTDPYAGTEGSRWVEVGYCGTKNIKCWLDTQTVEKVITSTTIENETLTEVSQNYVDILKNEGDYLTDEQFSSAIEEIEKEEDYYKKITMVNEILNRVFWSKEKVKLFYLRGNAYSEIFKTLFARIIESEVRGTDIKGYSLGTWGDLSASIFRDGKDTGYYFEDATVEGSLIIRQRAGDEVIVTRDLNVGFVDLTTGNIYVEYADDLKDLENYYYDAASDVIFPKTLSGVSGDVSGEVPEEILQISDAGERVLAMAKQLEGTSADKSLIKNYLGLTCSINEVNCWNSVMYVYSKAGVTTGGCVYSDDVGKKYSITSNGKSYPIEMGVTKNNGQISFIVYQGICNINNQQFSESELVKKKYDNIMPGDILSIVSDPFYGHNVIFIEWTNKNKRIAKVFEWMKNKQGQTVFGYSDIDISETGNHPLYVYWTPKIAGTKSTFTPSQTQDTSTLTMGQKIFQEAGKLADLSTDNAVKFVTRALKDAGVSIPDEYYLSSLINNINSNSNFEEVNINNLEAGDVILIGKECNNDYSVGIFHSVSSGKIYFYSNVDDGVELVSVSPDVEDGMYIYRAYRYVGDLSSSEKSSIRANLRTLWTLDSAITKVSTLKGDYSDNQNFADQLVFDGILTKSDCEEMTGAGWFSIEKDMNWLKKKLLEKTASSGQAESIIAD